MLEVRQSDSESLFSSTHVQRDLSSHSFHVREAARHGAIILPPDNAY